MSTPSTTALGRLLEAANEGGGKEVVMQSDQVPYLVSSGNQSALGDVTSSGQLFEMLSEVLTDEQQVDLAVGNIVEFTLTVGGVGWHLLTEPGVDGVSVRGRVSGGMSAEGRPGKSVQLPAVESSVGFGTGQFEADDLPPPLDDELEIALEEVPDVDDAFSADAFSPATPGAPTPGASPDQDASVDFGFAGSPDAASAPADPFAAGPDPFDDDPFGGLEAPRSGTRNVPTVEEPAAADASASDVGIPADDDEPPPVLDDDEFTADFAFVGPGEPPAAAQTPEKSAGKDRSEASTSAATLMRIPATGENETAAAEASVAGSSEDVVEEVEQTVDDAAAPRPETDAAMPRRRPSSGATVRISAAEAANEMARQLARQSSTREIERQ